MVWRVDIRGKEGGVVLLNLVIYAITIIIDRSITLQAVPSLEFTKTICTQERETRASNDVQQSENSTVQATDAWCMPITASDITYTNT